MLSSVYKTVTEKAQLKKKEKKSYNCYANKVVLFVPSETMRDFFFLFLGFAVRDLDRTTDNKKGREWQLRSICQTLLSLFFKLLFFSSSSSPVSQGWSSWVMKVVRQRKNSHDGPFSSGEKERGWGSNQPGALRWWNDTGFLIKMFSLYSFQNLMPLFPFSLFNCCSMCDGSWFL